MNIWHNMMFILQFSYNSRLTLMWILNCKHFPYYYLTFKLWTTLHSITTQAHTYKHKKFNKIARLLSLHWIGLHVILLCFWHNDNKVSDSNLRLDKSWRILVIKWHYGTNKAYSISMAVLSSNKWVRLLPISLLSADSVTSHTSWLKSLSNRSCHAQVYNTN